MFLDPGLGKTSITLAWILRLKEANPKEKILVIAPIRVCHSVWPNEIAKWDEFKHLKCSIVHGTPAKRLKALQADADIYLVNPEGVPWLTELVGKRELPWSTLVIDESSKFKNWGSKRVKALKPLLQRFKRRLILTGTPSPRHLEDLFSQMFVVDLGNSLGDSIMRFRTKYFYQGGYEGREWLPTVSTEREIVDRIAPACMRLSAKDYLELPAINTNDVWVDLPPDAKEVYKSMEEDMFLELEGTAEVTAFSSGSKYLSCRQIANGGIYSDGRVRNDIHDAKIDAILDIVDELQGKPVLVAFPFRQDVERLAQKIKHLKVIDGRTTPQAGTRLISAWNQGEIEALAVQPMALSHGVNMQAGPGRDIIWLGLTDDLENYIQLNARIYRQGVTGQVRVHHILAKGTVDVAMLRRLRKKDGSQMSVLESIKQYRGMQHVR